LLEAGRRERQNLERNLHDGAQQRLIALSLELGMLEQKLGDRPDLQARLDTARRDRLHARGLRDVARGIHPAVLSGHGLAVALESIAARAPLPVRLTKTSTRAAARPRRSGGLLRRLRSLTNVAKHAEATTRPCSAGRTSDVSVVEIVDNGVGGAYRKGRVFAGSPIASRRSAVGSSLDSARRRYPSAGRDSMRVASPRQRFFCARARAPPGRGRLRGGRTVR
jgi:signal transduction histidine kinase